MQVGTGGSGENPSTDRDFRDYYGSTLGLSGRTPLAQTVNTSFASALPSF